MNSGNVTLWQYIYIVKKSHIKSWIIFIQNPLQEHLGLVKDPSEYKYSSAAYYEKGIIKFPFLKDLREVL